MTALLRHCGVHRLDFDRQAFACAHAVARELNLTIDAILVALRGVDPSQHVEVASDNLLDVKVFRGGRSVAGASVNADLWQEFWAASELRQPAGGGALLCWSRRRQDASTV